ncbi:MAG: hypothetical protein ABIA75_03025 [Candidatus Neomarinimicrobiota bacterium]
MNNPIIHYLMIFLMLLSTCRARSDYYYYHPGADYGTELLFNPVTLLLNGSFDILRNGARTKDITAIDYRAGYENVIANISDPLNRIRRYGVEEFIAHEIFPVRGSDFNYIQYWPNYATHVFGNGMQYVKAAEWYDFHGFDKPYLLSGITTTAYQFLNEVVEHSSRATLNVDPIADLLIFNPVGLALFSLPATRRFFSETTQLLDWSLQPMLAPATGFLENAGQQYALKYPLPGSARVKGFVFWGIQGMVGASLARPDGEALSLAAGVIVNNLREKRLNRVAFMAPHLDGAIGLFHDRNNSLLYSVIISGPRLPNCRVNIFPGIIRTRWGSPGIYCGFGQWDGLLVGIGWAVSPVGLVHSFLPGA